MSTDKSISCQQKIHELLTIKLQPSYLQIIDDSEKHRGHAGAMQGGRHYNITISSDLFSEKNLLACHRMVYDAVNDLMKKEIHALQITILKS